MESKSKQEAFDVKAFVSGFGLSQVLCSEWI